MAASSPENVELRVTMVDDLENADDCDAKSAKVKHDFQRQLGFQASSVPWKPYGLVNHERERIFHSGGLIYSHIDVGYTIELRVGSTVSRDVRANCLEYWKDQFKQR